MKRSLLPLLFAAAAILPFSPAGAALDTTAVDAEARWVVHVDFKALRASAVGTELVAAAKQAQHRTTMGTIALDVPKLLDMLGSATAYGSNFSKDPHALDGTLILQGTPDLRKILEGLVLQGTIAHPQNVTELSGLPFPAYALRDPKNAAQDGVVVAFPPEPVVLVSKSQAQLLKARDVMRGSAASLAKNPRSPLQKFLPGSQGAFLFCASTVPSEEVLDEGPHARVLKMAQSLSVAIGETGPNSFAHIELVAASDQMADKLMKILQGMTAMLSLAETNDRQLAEFLNSTMVTREADTVRLRLAYSSERLIQLGKTLQEKQSTSVTPAEPARAAERARQLVSGTVIAEWTAENTGDEPSAPAIRTIENVALKNGSVIALGRLLNGGRAVRFTQVEITPAAGGAPLVFRREMMNNRGDLSIFTFPGVDGSYTVKVSYVNDGSGKATYAVGVRDPRSATAETKK